MRIGCAIVGSGNIGTDLMYKLSRSNVLYPAWMIGIDPSSDGLRRAREMEVNVTHDGVEGFLRAAGAEHVRIAFDATSASAHKHNDEVLRSRGIKVIDLTPAAVGPYCIPPVNLLDHVEAQESNLNMVTCGGQATIPMVHAVSRVQPLDYGEIVATVASRSAGPGTRKNIDEFTRTTAAAVSALGGAAKSKAIIILNPAEPPLIMRDTVHCLVAEEPRRDEICRSVRAMESAVQEYVPGYRIKNGPVFDGRRVSIYLEVEGAGDYLEKYAGNLDIMTAAATFVAERIATNGVSRAREAAYQ